MFTHMRTHARMSTHTHMHTLTPKIKKPIKTKKEKLSNKKINKGGKKIISP